jgi:predicted nuclease of predicted toxin-antitoxin system
LEKIQFHLDEQVELAIAEALRRRGIDVSTTPEAGLLGATDEEQLAFAISQERVIFTKDDDFLALHRRCLEHYGIAYCHQNSRSLGEIVRGLILIWEVLESSDMQNHIEFI